MNKWLRKEILTETLNPEYKDYIQNLPLYSFSFASLSFLDVWQNLECNGIYIYIVQRDIISSVIGSDI